MPDNQDLAGVRVLILEDDYYQANDFQEALEAANAVVIGPFGDEAEATSALVDMHPACAFVDVNLGNGPSFHVPRKLASMGIPFSFLTGYDPDIIPHEFAGVPCLAKPIRPNHLVENAIWLLQSGRQSSPA